MSWTAIALLVLSFVVAAIPVIGNAMIKLSQRKGWKGAEDFFTRWTPIAIAASKSKTREEAIAILVEEILSPDTPPATLRATQAALKVLPTVTAELSTLEPAGAVVVTTSKRPPPMLPLGVLCLFLSGCSAQDLQAAKSAGSIAVTIANTLCSVIGPSTKGTRFACKVVDAGSSVLGNMSSDERETFVRRAPGASFEVDVPAEQVDDFAKKTHATLKGTP